MKAVILAAGIASRLRPLTDNTPKCLLKVGQKKILGLTLDNLIANNIKDVVIVTGYLEEMIKDFINQEYNQLNVQYVFNPVYDSTNNIYSLWLTKDLLQGEEMLLLDSDIIFDNAIIAKLLHSQYKNCLALKRHEVHEEEIKVKVDKYSRILEIGKEVIPEQALGESIGIEKFSSAFVSKLFSLLDHQMTIEKKVNIFYEAAFQDLINEGESIYTVDVTEHHCMEIDTAQDLEAAGALVEANY